jgi:hypothetical protein
MSVHQGGKICLLSPYDAEQLEKHNVLPKCSEHRHCRIADAEQMRTNGLLRRISLPGRNRFAWLRSQDWKTVHTKMSGIPGAPRMPTWQMVS